MFILMTWRIRFFGEMSIFRGGGRHWEKEELIGLIGSGRRWWLGGAPSPRLGGSHIWAARIRWNSEFLVFVWSVFNEGGFSRHLVFRAVLMCGQMQILEAPGPKHLLKAYWALLNPPRCASSLLAQSLLSSESPKSWSMVSWYILYFRRLSSLYLNRMK